MPNNEQELLNCYISAPFDKDDNPVRRAINLGLHAAGFRVLDVRKSIWAEEVVGLLATADCVVVDLSSSNPNVDFEMGVALAMGKVVFPVVQHDSMERHISLDFALRGGMVFITYESSPEGLKILSSTIESSLKRFRESPRRSQFLTSRKTIAPFFIDWDKLDRTDADNLIRELLSQMGLRRVDWYKDSSEFDLIAEYPRKDPDGFEYRELWLVSTGRNGMSEMLLDMAHDDTEMFMHHLSRRGSRFENMWKDQDSVPMTFLWIEMKETGKVFDMLRERFSHPGRKRRFGGSVRMRFWDREYLTRLVQQFPNIGYKYFSEEGRSQSKFRKGPEELYQENVTLTDNLAKTIADLEEEKNRRVRAERDSVWKDISFSAAHKIGNPVFAIETNLGPLQKRITEDRKDEAVEVVESIRGSVEKAKGIVEQFKSLTKAQQITQVPTPLLPILGDSCRVLNAKGIECTIACHKDLKVLGDSERLSEVFDELVNNATHWFDKTDKKISVEASIAEQNSLPIEIDSNRKYVVVHFRDNGCGVVIANKDQIFNAFFSTYDQGTGIGLALVRRIVEGHGGAVFETGVPGVGADFEIYLPLSEDESK